MVCEKKKYFLLGINASKGTSLTPIRTSQSSIFEVTSNPFSKYCSSEKMRTSDDSTFISACGNSFLKASSL